MRLRPTLRLSLGALLLSACSSEATSPSKNNGETTPTTTPRPPLELTWKACKVQDVDGNDRAAECADVSARAFWDREDDEATFTVHLTRVLSKTKSASQLWLLNGGPGADGTSLGPYADSIASEWPFDVYLVDHRGTGLSNFLTCSSSDPVDCGKELSKALGENLEAITTTAAAHDVLELLRAAKPEGTKAFLLGMSYGTYWGHRVLQIDPNAFDGAILDGVCLGERCRTDRVGEAQDEGLREIMTACKKDTLCSSKLGADPLTKAHDLATASSTQCGLSTLKRRLMLKSLAMKDASAVPAFVLRVSRCNAGDSKAIATLTSRLGELSTAETSPSPSPLRRYSSPSTWGTARPGYSFPLGLHIRASEMTTLPAPTDETYFAKNRSLAFPYDGASVTWVDSWPRYERDAYVGAYAKIEKPLLLTNGLFDLQTSISILRSEAPHLDSELTQTVEHPTAGHVMLFESTCGYRLMQQFLSDPTKKIDTSCIAGDTKDYFKVASEHSDYWFGTTDAYDGTPP